MLFAHLTSLLVSLSLAATITRVSGCTDSGNTTSGCATPGGTQITIYGTQFAQSGLSIRVGNGVCTNDLFISSTQLKCTLPSGAGLNLPVRYLVCERTGCAICP